jgi:hypothetical protein
MKSNRLTGSVLLKVIIACALVVALVAVVVPAMAKPPSPGKKVEAGETWVVEETTELTRLTIEEGGSIVAPDGYELTMTVNNVGRAIKCGAYRGRIVLRCFRNIWDSGWWKKDKDQDKGGKYRVLNPAGIPIELPEMHGLAPRLGEDWDGLRILFYQTEANDLLLPALLERLEADYPDTTFDVIYTQAYGESTPTQEQIDTYDALIRGVSW